MQIGPILRSKGSSVATIQPGASLLDAATALAEHGIGALVVSGDGSTIDGIVSERDLARALARHGAPALALAVSDVMTGEVVTCTDRDTVDGLMALMTEQRIRHVPVVEDGSLRGIVSIGDVVKSRLHELQAENGALHEYITSGR
ncbi:MAG: CBS domain-containing protein [Acidimicrobiales bacterium]|jgi:CBS domain-containing protein|nr:CBS domain-containing protein [Acidimicrobiales bacterium]